ncbi:MAG TPA: hypothetical protein PKI62_11340 [bacterium]|nr:hypothetical protein [bacterium]HPR87992.1 hypothetical protein [bacterium]
MSPADVVGVWEGTSHAFGQESRLINKISVQNDGAREAETEGLQALQNIAAAP